MDVDLVIQCNGYFAHSENILVAMLGDATKEGIREVKVPNINHETKKYIDMSDWQSVAIGELPNRTFKT
ncbi:hypothetical protein ILUMI_08304 [Ignelater luminosus]|uniref:Uncharacterized protein n=1 Tax=Ignelater luminosus TaxID=2038154 RepID=A0A8K0GG24_IGNLU|nr:hypothetical protein ILUMI_08304 [Ignelater luminosus]